jgi:hypothetical protein
VWLDGATEPARLDTRGTPFNKVGRRLPDVPVARCRIWLVSTLWRSIPGVALGSALGQPTTRSCTSR